MSRSNLLPVALLLALLLGACDDQDTPKDAARTSDNTLTFDLPTFEVPEGESFTCIWTDVFSEEDMAVSTSFGQQGQGGHHITVYYADTPQDPHLKTCEDSDMESWRLVAGSGGDDGGVAVAELPEGAAVKVPAGKQLVIQAHYINFTGSTFMANDTVTLDLMPLEEVRQFASSFVVIDEDFEIPPHTDYYERQFTCRVPRDINAVLVLGHLHEQGLKFRLEEIDEEGNTIEVLYDIDEWFDYFTGHPPTIGYTIDAPLALKANTRLRQTCAWENETDEPVGHPLEMCVSFLFYYPDQGELFCENEIEGGDELTTPPESCVQPGDEGNDLGVGLHCTPNGGECRDTERASLCLATIAPDEGQWFCTRLCQEDADCGEGAVCDGDDRGKACIPARCL